MCLTQFVYEAAERGVFTTVEERTTLTTRRDMESRAELSVPPYESAEHEDSELYVDEPGCVEFPTVRSTTLLNSADTNEVIPQAALPIMLLEVAEADEPELENHSTLCRLMRTEAERDFIAGRGEDPESHLMKTWQLEPRQGSEQNSVRCLSLYHNCLRCLLRCQL